MSTKIPMTDEQKRLKLEERFRKRRELLVAEMKKDVLALRKIIAGPKKPQ